MFDYNSGCFFLTNFGDFLLTRNGYNRLTLTAVLFLRNNERGQRWHDKLVQRYGKAKAMSIIAQQLGRTVYYMLKRKEAFNPDKFYGDKKIENKDSGGEHLA